MEYRQDRILESSHYSQLSPPVGRESVDRVTSDGDGIRPREDIRYWSDFSRIYYHPRTIQTLPDLGDWESIGGDWHIGQEEFFRYNVVRKPIFFL